MTVKSIHTHMIFQKLFQLKQNIQIQIRTFKKLQFKFLNLNLNS